MCRKLFVECLEDRRVLTADFNGNGTVDAPDLGIWKTGFGTVGTATQMDGDANGDNNVDGSDFLLWQRTFGQSVPPPTASIDISIDGLTEAHEVTPGAIVFRNSDFSKQSLAMNQPEAGLPLYVPDYAAPATVFDPNAAEDFTGATVSIQAGMVGNFSVQFTYNTSQIRLWTTTSWPGFVNVGGGRFNIPSGVTLTPNSANLSFQIEGLQNSGAFGTNFIQVSATPTGGGAAVQDQGNYTVVEVNAAVDGNRDTAIDYTNSHDRQLLFWLNNDQEGFNETDEEIESEEVNITQPDAGNNVVDGRRDLEDLAPIRFNVDSLLFNNSEDIGEGAVTPGQLNARYSFEFLGADGEAMRVFFSNNTAADVIRHVNDSTIATVQGTDNFFSVSPRPAFTGSQVLGNVTAGLNAHLFEISGGAAYGETFMNNPVIVFVTEVFYPDGSSVEKRHEIQLDIRDIKSFYTSIDIPYLVGGTDLRTDLSFQHFPTPTSPTHSSQVLNEPFFAGADTTVLVHGWNMTDGEDNDYKAAFAETMYKRLYWQGYRGEFVAFNWPTFANEEGPDWPIFGENANITYNASDFQAYRSARALREILEEYRGEAPNLQPVHLLAHSMGNIVAGEALRQWAFDPLTEDPLVTTYVAMQAAVSAGAYGNNGTDSLYPGRPITDFYRFWSHGRDGFSDPGLGTTPYFSSTGFSSETRINLYNEDDYALALWDTNNVTKELGGNYIQSPLWPYDYEFEEGDGENINNDIFTRFPDDGPEANLVLRLPNGQPGRDAYEILAFFAQSASLALGTKEVAAFDENFDLKTLDMLGGSDIRANHSYQFNHDASETWGFYALLKTELGFTATYSSSVAATAPVAEPRVSAGAAVESESSSEKGGRSRLDWFLEPLFPSMNGKRDSTLVGYYAGREPAIRSRQQGVSSGYAFDELGDFRNAHYTVGEEIEAEFPYEHVETVDQVFDSLDDYELAKI